MGPLKNTLAFAEGLKACVRSELQEPGKSTLRIPEMDEK